MQELHASLRVELPEDPLHASATLATVAGAWTTLLREIGPEGIEATLTINETKAKPKGMRRPRVLPPEGVAA